MNNPLSFINTHVAAATKAGSRAVSGTVYAILTTIALKEEDRHNRALAEAGSHAAMYKNTPEFKAVRHLV